MTSEELADFIDHGIRRSHIYQPVVLIELLESGGQLKDDIIASKLLAHEAHKVI